MPCGLVRGPKVGYLKGGFTELSSHNTWGVLFGDLSGEKSQGDCGSPGVVLRTYFLDNLFEELDPSRVLLASPASHSIEITLETRETPNRPEMIGRQIVQKNVLDLFQLVPNFDIGPAGYDRSFPVVALLSGFGGTTVMVVDVSISQSGGPRTFDVLNGGGLINVESRRSGEWALRISPLLGKTQVGGSAGPVLGPVLADFFVLVLLTGRTGTEPGLMASC